MNKQLLFFVKNKEGTLVSTKNPSEATVVEILTKDTKGNLINCDVHEIVSDK